MCLEEILMFQEEILMFQEEILMFQEENLMFQEENLMFREKNLFNVSKRQEKTEAQFGNLKLAENCVIFKIKMIKIYVEKIFFLHVSILSTYFEWFVTFIMK